MQARATALRQEIEDRLAARIPAALSPMVQPAIRLQSSGNRAVDTMLGGGLPLGSLCEITGAECSGRSSLALSLLATTSHEGACAYIDVSDGFSPHAAAAAGVHLANLLWVRFAAQHVRTRAAKTSTAFLPSNPASERGANQQRSCGWSHPRGETKGLAPALEEMLCQKEERRRRKAEGTPGYPNQQFGLGDASRDQIEWEQFNSRKADDRDPLRQLDRQAAEAARKRAVPQAEVAVPPQPSRPWTLLDRAIRATDQVLQAGGFRTVIFDLGSIAPEHAQRIPASTWWRFQKAAKHGDSVFLILSRVPCAQSSAACVLECFPGSAPIVAGVLTQAQHIAQVSRQRTGGAAFRKGPGRVTSWDVAPAWMRAVGR